MELFKLFKFFHQNSSIYNFVYTCVHLNCIHSGFPSSTYSNNWTLCVQEIEVKREAVITWLKMISYAHGFRGNNLLKWFFLIVIWCDNWVSNRCIDFYPQAATWFVQFSSEGNQFLYLTVFFPVVSCGGLLSQRCLTV